ncbi:hypothetical protein [Streptomyces alboflavus]|uniref:hypothetical protein n=1 Tax=Streptomyces alboflavus TaxID=67267 RepID=UPI000F65661B|nr:hypothetical protein [Streptomyces alboflavus]
MGILNFIRSLGDTAKEVARGVADAIGGLPKAAVDIYSARQETKRLEIHDRRLRDFARDEREHAAAATGKGGPSPSPSSQVDLLPPHSTVTVPPNQWSEEQREHERRLQQEAARLAERHARLTDELARGRIELKAGLRREQSDREHHQRKDERSHGAQVDYELNQALADAAHHREHTPFALVYPHQVSAQITAETRNGTLPALITAPFFRASDPHARIDPVNAEFDSHLREALRELPGPKLMAGVPGLFRRPLNRHETDLYLIRQVLAAHPVVLVHGEITEGWRTRVDIVAWNLYGEASAAATLPEVPRRLGTFDALSPLVPAAVRLSLPFSALPTEAGRERHAVQAQIATVAAGVAAVIAEWFHVAAGHDPQLHARLDGSLDPLPRAAALGTAAMLDVSVDRGLKAETDALIQQAATYQEAGLDEPALITARRALHLPTPGTRAERQTYLDRVRGLLPVLDSLKLGTEAAGLRASAEGIAAEENRRRLLGEDDSDGDDDDVRGRSGAPGRGKGEDG